MVGEPLRISLCPFFTLKWRLHPCTSSTTTTVRADASSKRDELCGHTTTTRLVDTHRKCSKVSVCLCLIYIYIYIFMYVIILFFGDSVRSFFSVSASVCDSRNWNSRSNSVVRALSSGGGSNTPPLAASVPHLAGIGYVS